MDLVLCYVLGVLTIPLLIAVLYVLCQTFVPRAWKHHVTGLRLDTDTKPPLCTGPRGSGMTPHGT